MKTNSKSTRALHADHDLEINKGIAPPIFQSVTHYADSHEEFARIASDPLEDQFYGRYGNRNASRITKVIASLEGAEDGVMFASGMGAMSSAILAFLAKGDHVVAQNNHYIGTTKLLKDILPKYGIEVTMLDQVDVEGFAQAIRPETKMMVLETPVNPLLTLTDLEAMGKLAKAHNLITICDNTFATPILQRPIEWGIDLVVHSVTKYIGGHHDLIAGCVVGSRELIEPVWSMSLVLGAVPSAFNSWLALRGVRTLDMRVQKHCQSALALAEFLEAHPKVEKVYYPGLASHPQTELVQRQMEGKGGGLLSFDLAGGFDAGVRLLEKLQLIQNAASLGGIDSLAIHPAVMWGGRLPEKIIEEQGISPGMIRLAVGLEDPQDLMQDLTQAMEQI